MASRPQRRVRALGILVALAAAVAIPVTALADTGGGSSINPRVSNGATADIEGATLDNKLMATLRVAVTCDEITYFDWETYQEVTTTEGILSADGQLLQAQGRSIATAYGAAYGVAVVCDGSTVNHLSLAVIAQNQPLKRGDALVGASVWIGAGESEGNFASTGPVSVKLR